MERLGEVDELEDVVSREGEDGVAARLSGKTVADEDAVGLEARAQAGRGRG